MADKAKAALSQIQGDTYFANKAKHDAEIPKTSDPELLARAKQATEFVNRSSNNGNEKNPFAGLSREQLASIVLEFYLYDYARQERTVSVEALEFATGGWLRFPPVDPRTPYFMYSFDLNEDAEKLAGQLDCVHVYIGNPGSDVSSGISYEYSRQGRQLENFYFFFDGQRHRRESQDKIVCSVFSEAWNPVLDQLYRPELRDCQTVCLANKRTCDTVYFSGVTIRQLLFFLQWQSYPAEHIEFVRHHSGELDHLRFDVGVDYRVKHGQVEFLKSGYYGVF